MNVKKEKDEDGGKEEKEKMEVKKYVKMEVKEEVKKEEEKMEVKKEKDKMEVNKYVKMEVKEEMEKPKEKMEVKKENEEMEVKEEEIEAAADAEAADQPPTEAAEAGLEDTQPNKEEYSCFEEEDSGDGLGDEELRKQLAMRADTTSEEPFICFFLFGKVSFQCQLMAGFPSSS